MIDATAVSMVLLIGITINAAHAQELVDYTPHITSEEMEGKITASTFVLQQPRCVFKDVSSDDEIWLVVALSEAVKTFKNPTAAKELPYQSFNTKQSYMTLKTLQLNYPCPEKSEEITVLRVGTETKCVTNHLEPHCNGPLPGPGPYRVKFLAMNTGGVLKESKWSDPIKLIQGKSPGTIDVGPRRWRTETTIIATILPILFAVLLAALIASLVYKYSDICDKTNSTDFVGVQDPAIVRYTPHHVHDEFPNKS